MNKMETIDLSQFNELWDDSGGEGYATFDLNLRKVFDFLIENDLLKDRKQKYSYLVSKLSYRGGIHRDILERKGTIRKLLHYWSVTFGSPFSKNSLIEIQKKKDFEMEVMEKEARGRAAWGMYGACVRENLQNEQYQKESTLSSNQRNGKSEKSKPHPNLLIIG